MTRLEKIEELVERVAFSKGVSGEFNILSVNDAVYLLMVIDDLKRKLAVGEPR